MFYHLFPRVMCYGSSDALLHDFPPKITPRRCSRLTRELVLVSPWSSLYTATDSYCTVEGLYARVGKNLKSASNRSSMLKVIFIKMNKHFKISVFGVVQMIFLTNSDKKSLFS